MNNIFFIWRGKKENLELFVWIVNGVDNKVQFTLEIENDNYLLCLDVGIIRWRG